MALKKGLIQEVQRPQLIYRRIIKQKGWDSITKKPAFLQKNAGDNIIFF